MTREKTMNLKSSTRNYNWQAIAFCLSTQTSITQIGFVKYSLKIAPVIDQL